MSLGNREQEVQLDETDKVFVPRDFHLVGVSDYRGLPWWLSGKESACQCRIHRFDIPGSAISSEEGNGSPL